MKNKLKPLAKTVLLPSELTAAASATDAGVHKKSQDRGYILRIQHSNNISYKEMDGIMKIVKCLEEFGLLIKRVA